MKGEPRMLGVKLKDASAKKLDEITLGKDVDLERLIWAIRFHHDLARTQGRKVVVELWELEDKPWSK